MTTVVFLIGLAVGATLFWFAHLFLKKVKNNNRAFWLAIAGAAIIFSTLPWVQSVAKTFFVSNLGATLKYISDQVDKIQTATALMHDQLDNHQKQITSHQNELDSMQNKIRATQSELS